MKLFRWSHQDWFWLLTFVLYNTVIAYMYKDFLISIVSVSSTFVSVALAGVAIYISLKQFSNGDTITNEMHRILGSMDEKMGQVDKKVSSMDITSINEQIKASIDASMSGLKKDILKDLQTHTPQNLEAIEQTIDKKINETSSVLKSNIVLKPANLNHLYLNDKENTKLVWWFNEPEHGNISDEKHHKTDDNKDDDSK